MIKRVRDRASFENQLERQLNFLRRSALEFDRGNHDEAIRLATTLRVLLHDTQNSTSLLTHLGIKNHLRFIDTGLYRDRLNQALDQWVAEVSPGNIIAGVTPGEAGLVEVGIGPDGKPGWFPPLRERRFPDGSPKARASIEPQQFENWWNTPLVEASNMRQFSRLELVKIMANQDGGAHVDASLDQDYHDLNFDHLGVQMEVGINLPDRTMDTSYQPPPLRNNVAFASVRQIAFEFLLTMQRYLAPKSNPGIFALADPYQHLTPTKQVHAPTHPGPIVIGTPVEDE
jgi:hypothetical protein